MKNFKKLGVSLLTIGTLLTPLHSVGAAAGINQFEQRILDDISTPVEFNGQIIPFPAEYLNQARHALMDPEVDLEEEEVNQIIAYMVQARQRILDGGYESFQDMSQSAFDTILMLIDRAGAVVGFKISIDPITGEVTVINVNGNGNGNGAGAGNQGGTGNQGGAGNQPGGNIIIDPSSPIKQTGLGIEATLVVASGFVGALGACFVLAKKQGLFSMDEQ